MRDRTFYILIILANVVLVGVVALIVLQLINPSPLSKVLHPDAECRAFRETQKSVCGRFLAYWTEHGGLPQFGYPLVNSFQEISPSNQKAYSVQYFERAILEYHPEDQPPNDIILPLLGAAFYADKFPLGAPNQKPNTSAGSLLFTETGKRLGGRFLEYFQQHGGLVNQGFPISDEFLEISDLDGRQYVMQFFERAVFEYHPENKPPYDVLLTQLGKYELSRDYPNGEPDNSGTPAPK